ncbi:phage integrase SAM-like domain-containing protein [Mucilaginibacter celer]|uniref:Recombinase n=1 Tax=Mucilaginibacter celer TaxID=2305508 RepID=A0A494VU98_9SPHI|nr:phage integrase SAM-like domain-containing protein [Mucilaginibacter celer]AYL99167.1 recombinase [Mucilaginibacter celer]
MATVRGVIIPLEQKSDGTWNVKISVNHKGKTRYIKTPHYIGVRQIKKDFTIKDQFILDLIAPTLIEYRRKISELGNRLSLYDVTRLKKHLEGESIQSADEVDIIKIGNNQIEILKKAKRKASAANMQTVVNSLKDYFETEVIPITEIQANMLVEYERYLKKERRIIRLDQFKRPLPRIVNGLSDTGLHNHMRDLRILFNNATDFYNDENLGITIIKHYPFKKYKILEVPENQKPKLTIEQVLAIKNLAVPENTRMEIAKDLFMLSFYLCGMNAVDLYQLSNSQRFLSRVNYNRSKTRTRRKDKAFISIGVPPEAHELYIKYAGKLQCRYSTHNTLDRALSIGMRRIGLQTGIPNLEFYDARHAFGDWARNICRFSKDDVALALNHKDLSNDVTDIYISKNWKIIDEVQEGTIKLLKTKRLRKLSKSELSIELAFNPITS